MKTQDLISYIEAGRLNDKLLDIYIDESLIAYQTDRYIRAIKSYEDTFRSTLGYNDDVCIINAPGRTEIGGNHTDHQHGHVLTASINLDIIAIVAKNSEMINVRSEGYDNIISFSSEDTAINKNEQGTSLAMIKGVLAGAKMNGFEIGGFDAYITSDVLNGSGLSSSASFETVIGTIISSLYNDGKIKPMTLATIGQYAENIYFGKPCGLMDQMACAFGNMSHIDFKVPGTPKVETLNLDLNASGYSLCITDTKGNHADLTSEYAAVTKEMKSVAEEFRTAVLVNVPESKVIDSIPALREKLGDRAVLRALHFYEENKRVIKEVDALKNNDFATFLKTVKESGDSSFKFLQNVYTNQDVKHQGVSLALCISENILGEDGGVCRVHGGGFAGTIQAFVRNDKVEIYKKALDSIFGEGSCLVLKIRKYGGMKIDI